MREKVRDAAVAAAVVAAAGVTSNLKGRPETDALFYPQDVALSTAEGIANNSRTSHVFSPLDIVLLFLNNLFLFPSCFWTRERLIEKRCSMFLPD